MAVAANHTGSPPSHRRVIGAAEPHAADRPVRTPFGAIADRLSTRVADTALLLSISKHLEHQAGRQSDLVLLAAFQHAERFTPATARRYRRLAERLPFVAALGTGLEAEPVTGVRGATILPDDPLAGEWAVIALGPHYCGALIARDLGDTGDRRARRFEYTVTHDRPTVAAAARATMDRVTAAHG